MRNDVTMPTELPSSSAISARLLEDLKYEDDQWLWEIVWKLNADFPQVELADKVSLAQEVTWQLFNEGQIRFLIGQWPEGAVGPLDNEGLEMIREQTLPWHDPEHAEILVLLTRSLDASMTK
jgi:hypothetical protein